MKKRIIAFVITVCLLISCFSVAVYARQYSGFFITPTLNIANVWSGRDFQYANLTSAYPNPDTGNAGVNFYDTGVGFPENTVHSTSRQSIITLMEKDIINADDIVAYYRGSFGLVNGVYRICSYVRQEVINAPQEIEDHSGVELYINIKIQTLSGDYTYNIPVGFLEYKLWVD